MRELLARIDSRELSEWQAFARLEPFGEERADLRAAIIAATVANVWRDPKQPPFKPVDFMPQFDHQQPWEAQLALIENLHAASGGRTRGDRR